MIFLSALKLQSGIEKVNKKVTSDVGLFCDGLNESKNEAVELLKPRKTEVVETM